MSIAGVVEIKEKEIQAETGRRERRRTNSKSRYGEERAKVLLNQFYVLLLFTDPTETTIFSFLISRAKPFG